MRQLIVTACVSLDGVMEAPGGEEGYRNSGWTFKSVPFDAAAYEIKGREQEEAGAMLMGRRSYEAFAPVWPGSEDHAAYKDLPKYVVSTTITDDAIVDGWGPTTILRSTDDVAQLKKGDGGAIFIHGSADLARRLSEAGLIDRYHLLVFPVLLGAGKSLFSRADNDKRMLKLRASEAYGNGVVKLIYDVG